MESNSKPSQESPLVINIKNTRIKDNKNDKSKHSKNDIKENNFREIVDTKPVLHQPTPCFQTCTKYEDSFEKLLNNYFEEKDNVNQTTKTKGMLQKVPNEPTKQNTTNETDKIAIDMPLELNQTGMTCMYSHLSISNSNLTTTFDTTIGGTTVETDLEDAFLCNIPNAPPFILKMSNTKNVGKKKNSEDDSLIYDTSIPETTETLADLDDSTSNWDSYSTSDDDVTTLDFGKQSELHVFVHNACPGLENTAFRNFVSKSISYIKTDLAPKIQYVSMPTVCVAGVNPIYNPFAGESDSKSPGKNRKFTFNSDILCNKPTEAGYTSKRPRMLHSGEGKSKMKSAAMYDNQKGSNGLPSCGGGCAANKKPADCGLYDIQVNPYLKISVSTTCPSLTDTSTYTNSSQQKQAPRQGTRTAAAGVGTYGAADYNCGCPDIGDLIGPQSVPDDCGCPDEIDADIVEVMPCPAGTICCSCNDDETEEEKEDRCTCPPGYAPLLKNSHELCDCSNRTDCEEADDIEEPESGGDVFWALTKVSILEDGTKNFEIIDVSPVPPGYYMMPDVNSIVLVGPQPKKFEPEPEICVTPEQMAQVMAQEAAQRSKQQKQQQTRQESACPQTPCPPINQQPKQTCPIQSQGYQGSQKNTPKCSCGSKGNARSR